MGQGSANMKSIRSMKHGKMVEMTENKQKKVAVLIPCYNEELTIQSVIHDFHEALPDADIYVYDNNCTDQTADIAKRAGAIVRKEPRQGKGNVVRSMFRQIDADAYVLVDGDATYPAQEIDKLLKPVLEDGVDMAIGDRLSNGTYYSENKRPFHQFGNNLVRNLINRLFHGNIHDIMTGYRVFSKRFVKCMPVRSEGFQIETEMTVFALVMRMKICEEPIAYRDRPTGSFSKLNTFHDGFQVLKTLFDLYKDYRPMFFFFWLFLVLLGAGIILLQMKTAVAGLILTIAAMFLMATGSVLDSVKNLKIQFIEEVLNQYDETHTA